MLGAVFYGDGRIELKDVREPEPAEDEAILKVMATSICGSDVHIRHGTYPSGVKYPLIPGHEVAGEVVKIGSRVRNVKPGDRVVIEPHTGCGICPNCNRGYYSYCLYYGTELDRVIGFTVNGGYAEYVAVPARNLHKLPEGVSYEVGTLITTAGTSMFGIEEIGIGGGDTVAVLGTGPVGLLALQIAKAMGAGEVIVTGRRDERLNFAKELGADKVVNIAKQDFVEAILEMTDGFGADVVIETAGVTENFAKSIDIVKKGGRVLLLGFFSGQKTTIDADKVILHGITIKGTRGEAQVALERVLKLFEAGKLKLEPLITHRYKLTEIEKAFETVEKRVGDPVKVTIQIGSASG